MALASKKMSGGACRVWMLTGSRAQCPTTLAGLGLPLVPGLFLSPLVFTHPNLLRCRSLYLIHLMDNIPNCRLCPTPPQLPPHFQCQLLLIGKMGVVVIQVDLPSLLNR